MIALGDAGQQLRVVQWSFRTGTPLQARAAVTTELGLAGQRPRIPGKASAWLAVCCPVGLKSWKHLQGTAFLHLYLSSALDTTPHPTLSSRLMCLLSGLSHLEGLGSLKSRWW